MRKSDMSSLSAQEAGLSNPREVINASSVVRILRSVIGSREAPVFAGLAVVFTFFALATKFFLTPLNLFGITRQIAILAVISVGEAYVISCAEIDISVGAIYNLANTAMAVLIAWKGFNPWVAVVAALVVGALSGLLNGALSVSLGLPTLIVTLGTMSIYRALAFAVSKGSIVGNLGTSAFFDIGYKGLGPFTYVAIAGLIIVAFAAWYQRNTVFSLQVMGIGSNAAAAKRVGIRIGLRKIGVMALSGLLCGFAGALGLGMIGSASPESGTGYEMLAIAAVVIGGTPLKGGSGTIWGTLLGISLVLIIQDGLMLMGLPSPWQLAITGVILLFAVALQQVILMRTQRGQV